jgi:putative tricarboxylic transport membrane protein
VSQLRLSDRIAGAILLALAGWFWWQAGTYTVAFGDPAGPSLFPRVVAVPAALLSLWLLFRPDPNPTWFRFPAVLKQGVALVCLFAYPYLIVPLGFPAATFLAALPLSLLFGATWLQATITAACLGVGLFFTFDLLFNLPLPAGPFFG